MIFWDSSALVPLLVDEPATTAMQAKYTTSQVAVWWATPVECASALARLQRDGALSLAAATEAFRRLDDLVPSWIQIEPVDAIREVARRMLRTHPLQSGDAMQLAAAYLTSERRPPTLEIVTLDDRLREAALKEGFLVTAAAESSSV